MKQTTISDWNKKINLELTLKELQMLYDSFSITSYQDVKDESIKEKVDIPYKSNEFHTAFSELETIITVNGGYVYE